MARGSILNPNMNISTPNLQNVGNPKPLYRNSTASLQDLGVWLRVTVRRAAPRPFGVARNPTAGEAPAVARSAGAVDEKRVSYNQGPKRPHKHKDPKNHGFWNPPCFGPLSQQVHRILAFMCGPWRPYLRVDPQLSCCRRLTYDYSLYCFIFKIYSIHVSITYPEKTLNIDHTDPEG